MRATHHVVHFERSPRWPTMRSMYSRARGPICAPQKPEGDTHGAGNKGIYCSTGLNRTQRGFAESCPTFQTAGGERECFRVGEEWPEGIKKGPRPNLCRLPFGKTKQNRSQYSNDRTDQSSPGERRSLGGGHCFVVIVVRALEEGIFARFSRTWTKITSHRSPYAKERSGDINTSRTCRANEKWTRSLPF